MRVSGPPDHDLRAMVEALRHGPDAPVGTSRHAEAGVELGWVGYPSPAEDHGPVVARSPHAFLLFHGEHFAHGCWSALPSDSADRSAFAQALLARYLTEGTAFVRALNGWFAGVLVDLRSHETHVFNDRYGMQRVYVHAGEDDFLFATEAKALLRVRPRLRALDTASLGDLLRYDCVLDEKSLFKGVSLLPGASVWTFADSTIPRKVRYFDFSEWEVQPPLAAEEFAHEYAATVSEAFPAYTRGGADVAISLTAGLDTRQIMAALGGACRQHPCYTFDGTFGELFDTRVARKLAAVHESPFEVIRVGDAFLDNFGKFAERSIYVSDGTHEAFGAHDVYFNEIARKIASVRLTGKFGSEVVRVRNIVPSVAYPQGMLTPELASIVEQLPRYPKVKARLHPLTAVVTREIPSHEHGRLSVESAQLVMRTPYMDNAIVGLMYRAPPGTRAAGDLQERYVMEHSPEFAAYMTNLGRFASLGGLARNNPVVTRVAAVALRALFKAEYIYLYGTPHWLTAFDRKLPGLHLERVLAGRQKWEGYRIWSAGRFSDYLREMLLSPNCRFEAHFERDAVRSMVQRHVAGTHNYMSEINKVLSIELIHRSLLSAPAPTTVPECRHDVIA